MGGGEQRVADFIPGARVGWTPPRKDYDSRFGTNEFSLDALVQGTAGLLPAARLCGGVERFFARTIELILCPILFHVDLLSWETVGTGAGIHHIIVGAKGAISKYVRYI